ncbi:MAG: lipoxygenase family protein [Myxococcota bacterium]
MALSIFDFFAPTPKSEQQQLDARRRQYRYKAPQDNLFAPIAMLDKLPRREDHKLEWIAPYMPRYLAIAAWGQLAKLSENVQRATFRFDKFEAFRELFGPNLPTFAEEALTDQAFGYRRIAGGNPILIEQQRDLEAVRKKIPLDVDRVQEWLEEHRPHHWVGSTDVAKAAAEGRLFVADYELIQRALPSGESRDSRWRGRYAAAPIAVLIEAPGFYGATDMVPIAIQIDQPQPDGDYNPVYYPDDDWGWQTAKLYVEAADASHHLGCGHIQRCHLMMEAFCIATPRQLPESHCVYKLLYPHMQFTLTTNVSVYQYFSDRSKLYFEFYSGNLEELRQITVQGYESSTFRGLQIDREIESRGVTDAPAVYPYRDDSVRYWKPIHRFISRYVDIHYRDDRAVRDDARLQGWIEELQDPHRAALKDLVEDGRMDSRAKLKDLLTQVLFIAGPGHAAMHFAGYFYYRFSPAAPSTNLMPPPDAAEDGTRARYLRTLPTIRMGRDQWVNSTQALWRFGRFGHYDGYPLGHEGGEVDAAILQFQADLEKVEHEISKELRTRPYRYDFLLPSNVPNSINL